MFKKLVIDQFVIIDHLELDLREGLTILTGETGAGKSILLDATGLVLGDESERGSIRQGAPQADIRATFAPVNSHPIWDFLSHQGLVGRADTDFTVHRILKPDGNDSITLNNKPIELDLLKKIGTYLVEIHGQFANQSLLEPDNQLTLLDLSGGFEPEVFSNVANALADVRRYTRELEEENTFLATHKRQMMHIDAVMKKFDSIDMKKGFLEEVQREYAILKTAKETGEAFQNILAQLIAANGVVMGLSAANHFLNANKNLDSEKMEKLSGHLSTALDNARSAVTEMRRIAPEYDIDLAPLHRYEHILDVLEDIGNENKVNFEDLETYWETMSGKYNRFRKGRERLNELQDLLIKSKNTYRHHAHILSEKRIEAGRALSEAITAELAPLKLLKAEFLVKVEEDANLEWTERGLNRIIFTARMNPGQPFSPVSETASGGELARLILALKVVLQKVQTIPTLIFDEVDTGIGGAAAAAVGERIAQLADNTQVLVITHSPQVASRNNQHLHVSKSTDGISTTSVVRQLTLDESIDEISRMLAGDTITPESHAAAKSLVDEAKKASLARNQQVQTA